MMNRCSALQPGLEPRGTDYRYFYKRYLPHYQPLDSVFFITYRIKQVVPSFIYENLKRRHHVFNMQNICLSADSYRLEKSKFDLRQFEYFDQQIGKLKILHYTLIQPEVAWIISSSLHYRHKIEYHLICYCIMPNHVHILIKPLIQTGGIPYSLTRIIKNHKSVTAKMANRNLNRSGPFWQAGFYDRCIRNEKDYENVISYILNNPVKAGLITNWKDWKHTWISPEAF